MRMNWTKSAQKVARRLTVGGIAVCLVFPWMTLGRAATSCPTPAENGGCVVTPESSVQRPEDTGARAHTNDHFIVLPGQPAPQPPPASLYSPDRQQANPETPPDR